MRWVVKGVFGTGKRGIVVEASLRTPKEGILGAKRT